MVEGEKTADAARDSFPDHEVVTSPGGSKAAAKANWTPLAGRKVTIWPDADRNGDGKKYARDVADLLQRTGAASVCIVQVPGSFPDKRDLADPLPDGVSETDLQRLLDEANPVVHDGPTPLFPPLPPPEPYPIEALGKVLSPAANAIVRKVQVPEAIAGQAVLAAAALAAQTSVREVSSHLF